MSKSQVNNNVRTGLLEIVDGFTDSCRNSVWEFFDSRCCYCDVKLKRIERKGHMDHLVSKNDDGLNHLSNRALACNTCNGEKLEKDWKDFLKTKAKGAKYDRLVKKIIDWNKKNALSVEERKNLDHLRNFAKAEAGKISVEIEKSFDALRKAQSTKKKE